jgi:hypothetical protein
MRGVNCFLKWQKHIAFRIRRHNLIYDGRFVESNILQKRYGQGMKYSCQQPLQVLCDHKYA